MIVLNYTVRSADVYGYQKSQEPTKDIPIVTAATAYDCAENEQTYILVFNEYLWYGGDLDHSLHNPNQIRHNGIELCDNPFDATHRLEIDTGIIKIPLQQRGTKLGFRSMVSTRHELQDCYHIKMTNIKPWNPSVVQLSETVRNDQPPWSSQSDEKKQETALNKDVYLTYPEDPTIARLRDGSYAFMEPTSEEALLHEIEPSIVNIKELMISKIQVTSTHMKELVHI